MQAEFVCEKDPVCRKVLLSVHQPRVVYDDVTKRDVKDMAKVDLYTAGFPCQLKGEGRRDRQGRGLIFDHVLKYINEKLPKCFLLENVVPPSLRKREKEAFEKMLASLRQSEEYFVTWRVINARDYGIPQNRPRVFIVGLLRSAVSQPSFPWPRPATRSPLPLTRFLCGGAGVFRNPAAWTVAHGQLQRGLEAIRAEKSNPRTTDYALDIWSGRDYPTCMTDRVPCITRTRGAAGGYYITSVQRLLTVEEMLNLQGLPLSYRKVARREGVSDRQLGQMVGNAIPTNILRAILPRMLTNIGKQ